MMGLNNVEDGAKAVMFDRRQGLSDKAGPMVPLDVIHLVEIMSTLSLEYRQTVLSVAKMYQLEMNANQLD